MPTQAVDRLKAAAGSARRALPKVESVVDDSFDLAHEVLNAQHQFARDVIGRFYPLLDYVRTERQPMEALAPVPTSAPARPRKAENGGRAKA
jgi:hypothetical protein